MDKDIEDFLRQAKEIRLSDEESAHVRKMMEEKLEGNPVRAAGDACPTGDMEQPDPSFIASAQTIRPTAEEAMWAEKEVMAFVRAHPVSVFGSLAMHEQATRRHAFFSFYVSPLLASFFLLIGAGAGVSYAAESAVPGDALYPIKVHVNDAIETNLAFTPKQKAAVETAIARERVQEAETLAAKGKLDTATSTQLAADFASHLRSAKQAIAKVEEQGKPQEVAALNAGITQSLHGHTDVLEKLATTEADTLSQGEIAAVLQQVKDSDASDKQIAINAQSANGQIAVNITAPPSATVHVTQPSPGMQQIDVEDHSEKTTHSEGSNGTTDVHVSQNAVTHVQISPVLGLMKLSGTGATSSASSGSGTTASGSVHTSVHIEGNGSVNIQDDVHTSTITHIDTH